MRIDKFKPCDADKDITTLLHRQNSIAETGSHDGSETTTEPKDYKRKT